MRKLTFIVHFDSDLLEDDPLVETLEDAALKLDGIMNLNTVLEEEKDEDLIKKILQARGEMET